MRATDFFQQEVPLYRKDTNFHLNRRKFITIGSTILILLIIPITVIVVLQTRDVRKQADSSIPSGFVIAEGTNFTLDGENYRFVGVNRYGLANDFDIYRCGPGPWNGLTEEQFLDNMFDELSQMRVTVVRFFAFQSWTENGTNFTSFDRIINYADKYEIKLIPVLENQWADCTNRELYTPGSYKYNTWYQSGYLSPYDNYVLSYRDYVEQIVTKYKDNPTILMWQLMNEAESKDTSNNPDPDSLYNFANSMSAFVKSIDSKHLVSLGTIGTGQAGARGERYKQLHEISTIDVVEAHDYGSAEEALPGSPVRSDIGARFYVQDQSWSWFDVGTWQNTKLGDWTKYTGTIPVGAATPFQRIGLNLFRSSDWSGPIYIDSISFGSTVYDFEDGTPQGWDITGPAFSNVSNSEDFARDGSKSLKIQLTTTSGGGQIYIPAPANIGVNTTVTLYLYTPIDAPIGSSNSVSQDLLVAKQLNKPFFIGEVGIKSNCSESDCYTQSERADLFDAKLSAAFDNGVGGYVIWHYWNGAEDNDECANTSDIYCFDTKDPLVNVINIYTRQPPTLTLLGPDVPITAGVSETPQPRDTTVNILDIGAVVNAFGKNEVDPQWHSWFKPYDLDRNGTINIIDIGLVIQWFGSVNWPPGNSETNRITISSSAINVQFYLTATDPDTTSLPTITASGLPEEVTFTTEAITTPGGDTFMRGKFFWDLTTTSPSGQNFDITFTADDGVDTTELTLYFVR